MALQNSPNVNLKIHVTAHKIVKSEISTPSFSSATTPDDNELEKKLSGPDLWATRPLTKSMELGRPDINALVNEVMATESRASKILIAASGPESMLMTSRLAARDSMVKGSPNMHLHLEEFGW